MGFLGEDPAKYDNPQAFKSERYLGFPRLGFEYAAGDQTKRDHFSFGALATRPPKGVAALDAGLEVWYSTEFQAPKLFAVRFEPRRPEAADFVKRQWETALKEGYMMNGKRVDVNVVMH